VPALVFTRTFERAERRFLGKHPDLVERYKNVLRLLELEPDHPRLKLHALAGRVTGRYAVSITHGYSIVLTFSEDDDEVVLLAIGSHDEVYR
jgi:mRNA-degrading endonuclease YafQ of YafQ-DinJ toxin-antitoxin module